MPDYMHRPKSGYELTAMMECTTRTSNYAPGVEKPVALVAI